VGIQIHSGIFLSFALEPYGKPHKTTPRLLYRPSPPDLYHLANLVPPIPRAKLIYKPLKSAIKSKYKLLHLPQSDPSTSSNSS